MAFVNGEVFAIRVDAAGPAWILQREQSAGAVPDDAGAGYSVVVRSGDTISGIAARTGLWPVTAWSVPSGNINRIWPGQTVVYHGRWTPHARSQFRINLNDIAAIYGEVREVDIRDPESY